MAAVRAVLLLVFPVVGCYLGYRIGGWYTELPAIRHYFSESSRYEWSSRAGFTLIGLLVGFFVSRKVSTYIIDLADNLREMPANDKIALGVGGLVGLLLTFLLAPILTQIEEPFLRSVLTLTLALVMVYLSTQSSLSMREELSKLLSPYGPHSVEDRAGLKQTKILDTNIIIDGRISEICRAGFIEGTLYVPGFVLDELQLIADSADSLKRTRGRRGLDILNQMQKEFSLVVRTHDHHLTVEGEPVDRKLVRLAKELGATIVTNDFNLNKVAELEGVRVMNVNELANALKPVVHAGEEMSVQIVKEGKEPGQGIGYLDDGTMVVVEHACRHVGESVAVVVGSVLQTVQGKMIFGSLRDAAEEQEALMDRNLRNYYRGGGRRGGGRSH